MKAICLRLVAVCFLLSTCTCSATAASIIRLPDWFDAPSIRLLTMHPDGRTFTGVDSTDVFRWSADGGRTNLGVLPAIFGPLPGNLGPQMFSLAPSGVSSDGSTIIGKLDGGFLGIGGGFAWTAAGGVMPILDSTDGSIRRAVPTAVSADGSVIVGDALQNESPGESHHVPFRWTPSTGTTALAFEGNPQKISADGTVIAGVRRLTDQAEAFRWTEATGVVGLGFLPSPLPASIVWTMSDDGNVIFGSSNFGNSFIGPRGFRWSESSQMELLSTRGDDHFVSATSANGDVAIGLMRTFTTDPIAFFSGEEFFWSEAAGLETLGEFLVSRGLMDLEPIKSPTNYENLLDVSADGQTILGASGTFVYDHGYIVGTELEYWLLDLAAVPEPSTLCLLVMAAVASWASICTRNLRSGAHPGRR